MKLNRGNVALILTVTIWGGSFAVTRSLLAEVGPFTASVLRFFIAWLFLAPFAYRRGYRLSLALRPTFLRFGLTGIALFTALSNMGLVFTSASSASLIQAGIPAVTTLLSVLLLKERVSRLQLPGIALSVVGLLFVTDIHMDNQGSESLLGNLLVIGSIFAWATYTVQGKKLISASQSWLIITTASVSAGLLFLLPFRLANSGCKVCHTCATMASCNCSTSAASVPPSPMACGTTACAFSTRARPLPTSTSSPSSACF